jgi:stage VI sporulation protein D
MKGGVALSQGNQSSLRFSLEESVWFQRGQEVEELVSISLDPNITIQENEQYVTIRGTLELSGEYKRIEEVEAEAEELVSSARFIHSVEEREEGICEFLHRFPVDISIPNNRIQSIYDIDIVVESFDYLFPERSCMKLTADLKISGLYGEQQNVPAPDEELAFTEDHSTRDDALFTEEEANEEEQATVLNEAHDAEKETEFNEADEAIEKREEELQLLSRTFSSSNSEEQKIEEDDKFETFEAEARKQPGAELDQLPVQEQEASPASMNELTSASENAEKAPEEAPVEPEAATPEISFSAQRKEAPAPQAQEQFENNQEEEMAEAEKAEIEVKQEQEPVLEEESESSPEQAEAKKKKLSKKKTLSITEFLARKDEDRHAKLKVCIVQQGETIDQLAERYDITIQQLLRVNHLEANQDVYEGQVLYIPVAVTQKQ